MAQRESELPEGTDHIINGAMERDPGGSSASGSGTGLIGAATKGDDTGGTSMEDGGEVGTFRKGVESLKQQATDRARQYADDGKTRASDALTFKTKGQPGENTTLVVVATDATLTKAQAQRVAVMAQDGMARALRPVHTPLDGDIVFVGATCARPLADPIFSVSELGALAADVVARAIGRGVYEARALPFPDALPSWRNKFAS